MLICLLLVVHLVFDIGDTRPLYRENSDHVSGDVVSSDGRGMRPHASSSLDQAYADDVGDDNDPLYGEDEDVFEGDITFPQGRNIWSYAIPLDIDSGESGAPVKDEHRIWDNGIIPYELSPDFIERQRLIIYEAMMEFQKHTCVQWIPRTRQKDYVLIKKGIGCRSDVGKQDSINKITLGPRCFTKGVIMHEMMHTVGFYHEQSRADRDKYVIINWSNIIDPVLKRNFHRYTLNKIDHLGTEYDCDSIMHYKRDAFAKYGTETITPKTAKCKNMGQREKFSETDIKEINLLYKCPTPEEEEELTMINAMNSKYLWPGGIVPYTMSPNMTKKEFDVVNEAMDEFSKHSCIEWVPRSNEVHYVLIEKGSQCSSYVGRVRGKQRLNLGPDCFEKGMVMHEMMHTVGFFHEHSRADRDKYVAINFDNIRYGSQKKFRKYSIDEIDHLGLEYDCDSIMHYDRKAFSKNGEETITPRTAKCKQADMGQRKKFSETDIKKLNILYPCERKHKRSKPMNGAQNYKLLFIVWFLIVT